MGLVMADLFKTLTPGDVWGGILAVALIGSVAFAVVKWLHPVVAKVTRVLDLFLGHPAEQGIPAVPGVIERLDAQDARLEAIEHQITPNHGTSAHDKLAGRIDSVAAQVDAILVHLGIEPPA